MSDLPEGDALSLPKGWVETTLGELVKIGRGSSPRPIHDYLSDSGIPWVKIADATASSTRFIQRTKEFIKEAGRSTSVKPNDLIVSNSATPGIPKIMRIDACVHDGWLVFDDYQNIDKWYLFYFFLDFRKRLNHSASGTVFKNLKIDIVKAVPISLPPLPEQKAIADMLSSFDEKIELLREQNKTLETLAQTIFKEWFVNFNYPDPHGKPYRNNGGAMVASELGLIPQGWRVGSLLEVFDLIGGGTPKTSVDEYWNGGIPWYSVVDAPKGSDTFVIDTEKKISAFGLEKSSTKLLRKGTTIVSARGTVGKLALVGREAAMNQSCYGIQGKGCFGDYYVYFQLKEALDSLKSRVHGAVFDTITQSTFKNIMVSLPENNLVASFEKKASPIMDKILNNILQIQSLSITRDTLLPKLMNGQVRVQGETI